MTTPEPFGRPLGEPTQVDFTLFHQPNPRSIRKNTGVDRVPWSGVRASVVACALLALTMPSSGRGGLLLPRRVEPR